jgi:prolyl oligopeptidase
VPPSQGGFFIPEAKSRKCWKDRVTLLVGSDFGPGSMTKSGYPRTCREWVRGTPLELAPQVLEGPPSDISVSQFCYLDRGRHYELRHRSLTFYESEKSLSIDRGPFMPLRVPNDADVSTFGDRLLVTLRSAWHAGGLTHPAGSLLSMRLDAFVEGRPAPITPLFLPTASASIEGFSCTRSFLILAVLDNVRSELRFWRTDAGQPSGWVYSQTFHGEGVVSLSARGVDESHSDQIWVISTGYLTPTSVGYGSAEAPSTCQKLKSLPALFGATGLRATQRFATSADGTRVPYFLVERKDAARDGSTPTLLYAYGGFEISLTPG